MVQGKGRLAERDFYCPSLAFVLALPSILVNTRSAKYMKSHWITEMRVISLSTILTHESRVCLMRLFGIAGFYPESRNSF
jgi:hypothetical protein